MSSKTETTRRFQIFYFLRLLIGYVLVRMVFQLADSVPYVKQGFFCDDTEIRYPFKKDTIDTNQLTVSLEVIGIIMVTFVEHSLITHLTTRRGHRLNPRQTAPIHPLLYHICSFLLSMLCMYTATNSIVELAKKTVSRVRPNFLALCQPNLTEICPPGNKQFLENYVCYGEGNEDMYYSFPSGHSALCVCVCTFGIYYLYKRCKFPEPICSILQLALALYASFVCFSRVRDHKHHPSDVLVGVIIGVVTAIFYIFFVMRGFKYHRYETEEAKEVERSCGTQKVSHLTVVLHDTKASNPSLTHETSDYGSFCNSSTEFPEKKAEQERSDIP